MLNRWNLALFAFSLFCISCASQKNAASTETAFTPQVQLTPALTTDAPKVASEQMSEKTTKPKKIRRAPKASNPIPPPVQPTAENKAPESSLTELPALAKDAPVIVPQEASADMGGFFANHFSWVLGICGGIGACYLLVAWRRRKQS